MWPARIFPARFWTARFWLKLGMVYRPANPARLARALPELRVGLPGAERRVASVLIETRVAVAKPRGGRIDG